MCDRDMSRGGRHEGEAGAALGRAQTLSTTTTTHRVPSPDHWFPRKKGQAASSSLLVLKREASLVDEARDRPTRPHFRNDVLLPASIERTLLVLPRLPTLVARKAQDAPALSAPASGSLNH